MNMGAWFNTTKRDIYAYNSRGVIPARGNDDLG